jgi:hypothetical protein
LPSSTIDQAYGTHILGKGAVTALISTRFYYIQAPQQATYPFGTYYLVSDPHEPFSFAQKLSGQCRIQTNVYHTNRYSALSTCDTIRDQVHLDAGPWDSLVIHSAVASGTIVRKVPDMDVYHAMFDILVTYVDA